MREIIAVSFPSVIQMSPSKTKILPFTIVCSMASLAILMSTPAQSQGGAKGMLMLQPTSPGITQSGHANISGTIRAGSLVGGTGRFSQFTSVGRTSGPVTNGESFGIGESAVGFDGMYVKTASGGEPFYGYWAGPISAYHFFDSDVEMWKVNIDGSEPLAVGRSGIGLGGLSAMNGWSLNIGTPVRYESGASNQNAFDILVTGANARGIESFAGGTGDAVGLFGRAQPSSGIGVLGDNTNGVGGIGVRGFGWSNTSTGVQGVGGSFGVDGLSEDGYGVQGKSTGGHGVIGFSAVEAVVGVTTGVNKAAVHGYTAVAGSDGGWFVAAAGTGDGVGVIGQTASGAGYGVQSIGRFMSTGTKAFRIDHPLEPETKFLNHYCSEGPEPTNMYSGQVTTDANGFANVELPEYFESINRDSRIQLTVEDASEDFVMAKIVSGIQGNAFRIRANKPGVSVHWLVIGVRNDKYMQRYGAPVEVEKSPMEVGRYQHPELYGAEPSRGLRVQPRAEKYQAQAHAETPMPKRVPLPTHSRSASYKK